MAIQFPQNPSNGDTTTINGVVYTYNSTKSSWNKSTTTVPPVVKGHVLPETDQLYDLGSATKKFRDLYLSGNSLHIGDATISSDGSTLTLPAGSTVAGVALTGATGLESRITKSVTINYDPGVEYNVGTITNAYKGYAILKIETTAPSWVRVYTNQSSRTADASRDISVDPEQGSGVIAEVITTSADTVIMSPGVIGFNDESTPNDEIYVAVNNYGIEIFSVTVTLTLIPLEV